MTLVLFRTDMRNVQSVILRHRSLEATSHRLELTLHAGRCRAVIRRLLEDGPITTEFSIESLVGLEDLQVGAERSLGAFRFERLSDVYRLRYRHGSRERDCLFVEHEEFGLAIQRLAQEVRVSRARFVA